LISERFDDTLSGKELVRSDVLLDEIEAVSEGPVSGADEGSLRDRVRTYWQSMQKGEPPRVLGRLQLLREWSHEQVKEVFT